jgi:hypothetical protein
MRIYRWHRIHCMASSDMKFLVWHYPHRRKDGNNFITVHILYVSCNTVTRFQFISPMTAKSSLSETEHCAVLDLDFIYILLQGSRNLSRSNHASKTPSSSINIPATRTLRGPALQFRSSLVINRDDRFKFGHWVRFITSNDVSGYRKKKRGSRDNTIGVQLFKSEKGRWRSSSRVG